LLVQRLTAALRVSDAIRIIDYVSCAGVSSTKEVILYCAVLLDNIIMLTQYMVFWLLGYFIYRLWCYHHEFMTVEDVVSAIL
jgi:hypothetical protein